MKEASPNPRHFDRIRSWAQTKGHGGTNCSERHADHDSSPISNHAAFETTQSGGSSANGSSNATSTSANTGHGGAGSSAQPAAAADPTDGSSSSPAAPSPQAAEPGPVVSSEPGHDEKKKNIARRFLHTFKTVLLHTKLNLLLVFVPIGIAVNEVPGMSPAIIFAMNAIAIVPLAGLLSFATETVARRLGDSLGALLNVTFGNAVELIIL